MNQLRVYWMTCVLMMVATLTSATTIVMPTDEQLIAKAPVIVEGTIVSSEPYERDGAVWTETILEVARSIKGNAGRTITIREIGGRTAERITKVYGTPEFASGEQVLLFLDPAADGSYRTMDLLIGKFKQARAANGRRLWLRDEREDDVTLLNARLERIEGTHAARDAAKFEMFLAERTAGRSGVKDYGVENPVLEGTVADSTADGMSAVSSDFTLISEPRIARWTRFDSGLTAPWFSTGTQPGYSDGGVSELRTAMSSWSDFSSANINYTYSGSRSGPMGGLTSANGANEVLFNDPLDEIAGTFTGSGVVGRGGYNGSGGGVTWTAPFTADASHVAGPQVAYPITEGNLTIQNGVGPATGIGSSRLAEIIAHEFGHTLGFGHSATSSALMYATVSGGGPSLRADDQLAARWLYPNGSAPPPPPEPVPAAPSALTGSVSGDDVALSWNDNASNESGYRVYLSLGSGSFSKVADPGVNVRNTTLTNLSGGNYRAYVVAWNSAGASSQSNTFSFTIATSPVAAFTRTPASGTTGVTNFTFYDESTGTVSSRSWSFGDGSTSTAAVASHVYSAAGTYTVTLTVTGNGASSQTSKTVSVTNGATAPVASFRLTPTSGTAGLTTFSFYDESTGTISTRTWNFGDGATSGSSVPSHMYASAGNYTVTLTVSGSAGSSQTSRAVSVTSQVPVTPQVTAAFDVSPASAVAGMASSFYDRSGGSPTKWAWSFGDGSTSAMQNPQHTYAAAGSYMVTLTASNSASSGVTSRQVVVNSLAPYRTLVSAAAQTSGAGGTSWRTELTMFNAGTQGANVTVLFLPNAGGNVVTRTLALSPRQATTYANALVDLFGIFSGAGALAIEATSAGTTADLRVTSRTFTSGAVGTFGQAVPDVEPQQLERTLYVTGIEASTAYRTNIGLVNRAGATVSATLTLYSPTGGTIGTKTVSVAGNSFQQNALATYFPDAGSSSGVMTMRLAAGSADSLSAYASVIDNRTQDPIYVQAVPAADGSSMMLPVVSRANGAGGTYWRSDVTLFNPTGSSQSITLRFDGSAKTVSLGGGDTKVLTDVVSQFGRSAGTAPLLISWSGGNGPVVTSRTYTTAATGGSYGQSVDPVAAFARQMFVTGLRTDAAYRSNVGFVNGGTETEVFYVRALSAFGTEIGRTTLSLAPNTMQQQSAAALFPGAALGSFTLVVEGDGNAQLFAYGSMVDNMTGDPVFYAGR